MRVRKNGYPSSHLREQRKHYEAMVDLMFENGDIFQEFLIDEEQVLRWYRPSKRFLQLVEDEEIFFPYVGEQDDKHEGAWSRIDYENNRNNRVGAKNMDLSRPEITSIKGGMQFPQVKSKWFC